MKIIIIAPKSITRHRNSNNAFLYDYAYWNFYLPLQELGHHVVFHDTSFHRENHNQILEDEIKTFKPDLLFCVMTGDVNYCPSEPWEAIEFATKTNITTTFNWFCDDSWRFDSFSKVQCWKFHSVSTPEYGCLEKYKEIGYENVLYGPWHANHSLYSGAWGAKKTHAVAFVGNVNASDRNTYVRYLEEKIGQKVFVPKNVGIEGLVEAYSRAHIGLNFSKSMHNGKPQAKARPFEVLATGCTLMTEGFPDIKRLFEVNKEVYDFESPDELAKKVNFLLDNKKLLKMSNSLGLKRFVKEHSSTKRLESILENINYVK